MDRVDDQGARTERVTNFDVLSNQLYNKLRL
jgi:hypothetical protein